jgi:hypothetical protein
MDELNKFKEQVVVKNKFGINMGNLGVDAFSGRTHECARSRSCRK